jgi:hypothetical protein
MLRVGSDIYHSYYLCSVHIFGLRSDHQCVNFNSVHFAFAPTSIPMGVGIQAVIHCLALNGLNPQATLLELAHV